MKTRAVFILMNSVVLALSVVGCVGLEEPTPEIDAQDDESVVTLTGPDHDADVQLSDADLWIVPPIPSGDTTVPEQITWTLLHPRQSTKVNIRRTCTSAPEKFLFLSDPPNWSWSSALATFHACGEIGDVYSTISLIYDEVEWVGVSATGAATLLPPH